MPDDLLNDGTNDGTNDGSNNGTQNTDTMTYEQWTEKYNNGGWRETLPQELATDASLANFKKPEDIVKSYIHTKKAFGDRIERPKEDWKKSDWDRWNREYNPGYPKDPAEYNFQLELDGYQPSAAQEENFRKWAYENGLSRSQAERTWKNLNMERYETQRNQIAEAKKKVGETVAALRREHGNAYDDAIAAAQKAMKTYLPEEYIQQMKSRPIDKEIIDFFIKVGKNLKEGTLEKSSKPSTNLTPREALSKYNKYVEDNQKAYLDRRDPRHDDVVRTASALMKDAYPEEE